MTAVRPTVRVSLAAAAALALTAVLAPTASAKVSSSFGDHILTLRGGKASERAAVACTAQGMVTVNGRNPGGGAVACSLVSEVDAVMGEGDDRVDLSGVGAEFGQKDFPGFGHGTGAAAELGPGNDRYAGSPTAFNLFVGGEGNDRVRGGAARDSLSGGSGDDRLIGLAGRDVLLGNAGADRLAGGADDDLLSGNAGNDVLNGGAGADLLGGGAGIDRLLGGAGRDQLVGGAGKDRLNGGPGKDEQKQ
jgi:Ca2+-binding RTX toxin-like protein